MMLTRNFCSQNCVKRLVVITLSFVFLVGTACAPLLSPGEPPAYIQFAPEFHSLSKGTAATRKLQLTVTMPTTPTELSSDAIILFLNGRELRRLAGYRWVSTIPELTQRAIVNGLDSSGAFAAVSSAGAGIRPNVRLLCDMEQFAFEYPEDGKSSPKAILKFTFKVVEYSTGIVLGSLPITMEKTAVSSNVDHMAEAAESAMADMLGKLSVWLVERLS